MRRAWQPTPVFLLGESPWTEEPGGLQPMGLQTVGHDWVTKHRTVQDSYCYYCFLIYYTSVSSRKRFHIIISVSPMKLFAYGTTTVVFSHHSYHLRLIFQTPIFLAFHSVQSLSRVWLFATPWTAARQASLSITNSRCLLKLMSFELVMTSDHLILSHPLLLVPSIFPSIRVFSNVSCLHQVAKVLELQLQQQSFQWVFRTDFFENWLVCSPCSPRDSQESCSNTTVQKHHFSALNILRSPTLTSIHDYWKNHNFD